MSAYEPMDDDGIRAEASRIATHAILHGLLRELAISGREGATDNVYRWATEAIERSHQAMLASATSDEFRSDVEDVIGSALLARNDIFSPG